MPIADLHDAPVQLQLYWTPFDVSTLQLVLGAVLPVPLCFTLHASCLGGFDMRNHSNNERKQ